MNSPDYSELKVLILDDSKFVRSVMTRILKSIGVDKISEASSGDIALKLLGNPENNVDIIFCDLMMPDMDGIEFLRHVEFCEFRPAFLFVSGAEAALLETVEQAARARNLHVLGSVKKPFTQEAAIRALNDYIIFASKVVALRKLPTPISIDDLQAALDQDQIQLHYQPKISLADNELVGFESLARWQHPERGAIPPDVFILAAEELGMIGAVTERTVTMALRQCAAWNKADLHKKMSLNLSAFMLVDTEFPQSLFMQAEQYGVSPDQLVLEVTETGVFSNLANTLEILARLKLKGFLLSIDDFGTGYSSLQQLSRVPFTEMKLDRSFVHGVSKLEKARAILKSSVDLGKKLGMTVVAEGVELKEDWDVLQALGVDVVQGYYIAKPMAAELIPMWSEKWASNPHAA